MAATSMASGKRRTRRWWGLQFGLRSLLGLMVAACLVMGAWRIWIHPYEEQRRALAEVAPLAVHIDTEPGRPAWLGQFFEPGTFRDVTHLAFDGKPKFTDAHLAHLAHFPRLNRLSLDQTSISDAGLAHLAGLSQLDTLSLNRTRITGEGLSHLRGLKNLKRLELGGTKVKGSELDVLAGLNLEFLELDNLEIEDEHLQALASLKELQTLSLHASHIRGPGLQSLQRLPKLTHLQVASPRLECVDIAGFAALEEFAVRVSMQEHAKLLVRDCPQLEWLTLDGEFKLVDLRSLPRLKSFSNHFVMRNFGYSPELMMPVNEKDREFSGTVRIQDLSGLEELDLGSRRRLSLDVRRTPALRKLRLALAIADDKTFIDAPSLEQLHLECLRPAIQSSFPFEQFAGLRRLILESDSNPSWELSKLGVLPNLAELSLLGGKLEGPVFERLQRLEHLKSLDVRNCQKGYGTLRSLRGLQSLERLHLEGMRFGANESPSLGTLHILRSLALQDFTLTDNDLVHLYCLSELHLVVVNATIPIEENETPIPGLIPPKISPVISVEAIKNLSLALPSGCRVIFFTGTGPLEFVEGKQVEYKRPIID